MPRGHFIVVEGLEGAGKSSIIEVIREYLEPKVSKLHFTREPGGTHAGEIIRSLLKEHRPGEELNPKSELLLIYAARIQLLEQVIIPALNKGEWVIADRFELSTFAYQGGGRGLSEEMLQHLSTFSLKGFKPDILFFLDIAPEIGLQRAKLRGAFDRIEQESLEFFQKVYDAYHKQLNQLDNAVIIDASMPLEEVKEAVSTQLHHYFITHAET